MKRTPNRFILLLVLLIAFAASHLWAGIPLYDNTQDGPLGGLQVQPDDAFLAQPFLSGSSGLDKITSVTLSWRASGSFRGMKIEFQIWKADENGLPGTLIGSLGSTAVTSQSEFPEFTTVEGKVNGLQPNAVYFSVLRFVASKLGGSNTLHLGPLKENEGTNGAGPALVQKVGQSDWLPISDAQDSGDYLQMRVIAAGGEGRIEETVVRSPGLAVNKIGDRPSRRASVYLPPGYDSTDKRYPVVYLCVGTGSTESAYRYLGRNDAEPLINSGRIEDMILVSVDSSTAYVHSQHTNSVLNGYHEDYLVRHLVDHIDATYRTIPHRNSRGMFGHSAGGYGAIKFGMKYPHVFGAIFGNSSGIECYSSGCAEDLSGDKLELSQFFLDEELPVTSVAGLLRLLSLVSSPAQLGQHTIINAYYLLAAAFSPNLANPPLYVDLPFDLTTGDILPEIRNKWNQHDLFVMLEDHAADLASLRGLAPQVGRNDLTRFVSAKEAFHQALLDAGVPHRYILDNNSHNTTPARRRLMLEFFNEVLEFNPTDDSGAFCQIEGVIDHTAPSADAGKDWLVELLENQETVAVLLDASASTSGSAGIVAYDWFQEETLIGEGEALEIALPLGRHVIHLVVTDAKGCQGVTDVIVYVHRISRTIEVV